VIFKMAETLSGTTTFDLPIDELVEEALEGLGGEHTTEIDMKHARRSLNLLLIDLQNRGMAPLSSLEVIEVPLVSGSSEGYSLGQGTFSVLDFSVRVSVTGGTDATDLPIERISYTEWLDIPTKTTPGRPTHFMVDKQRNDIKVNVWPVPDSSTKYKLYGWVSKRLQDVSKTYQLIDTPHRYLPALVKGLRYYMSDLRQGIPLEERMHFKREYLEALEFALAEDRERVDFMVYPANKNLLGGA
jgi:hypothetical protein